MQEIAIREEIQELHALIAQVLDFQQVLKRVIEEAALPLVSEGLHDWFWDVIAQIGQGR